MGKVRTRLCVFAAVFVALGGFAHSARALVLDWDAVAWNPGSLNNSYDLNADTINDITVSMTAQSNTFTNDPTTGAMTPTINQTITGGQSPAQNTLMIAGNLFTHSDLTVHLSFTGAPPGANNVSFTIFDIDVTTNADIISSIFGVTSNGTLVAPTISNVGSSVTLSGGGLSQVLTGNTASPNSGPGSGNGNATITFGATIITDIYFVFSNTAGAPRYQDIAIGDISFTPVPEINPAMVATGSCIAAVVFTILLQRRARRARQAVR
jgi:hypothetical protein